MLVVVGGHSRNTGKTSEAAGLIRKLRDRRWTAVKITQYGHGVCSQAGKSCGCEAGTDAERSFWLRTPAGELARAGATLRKLLAQSEHVIVESNSVMELVRPYVFLMLLDFSCGDFKPSSLRFMDRADAFVVIDRGIDARGMWDRKPPRYVTAEVARLVRERL